VLTVCDRKRLNSATFVPDAMHTATKHNVAVNAVTVNNYYDMN